MKKIYIAPKTKAEAIIGACPFLGTFPSTIGHGDPGMMPARKDRVPVF